MYWNLLWHPLRSVSIHLQQFHGKYAVAVGKVHRFFKNMKWLKMWRSDRKSGCLPSAGGLVHLGGDSTSVFVAKLQQFAGFGQTLDVDPSKIWTWKWLGNKKTKQRLLSFWVCRGWRLSSHLSHKRCQRRHHKHGERHVSWTWSKKTVEWDRRRTRCRFRRMPPIKRTDCSLLLSEDRIEGQIVAMKVSKSQSLFLKKSIRCHGLDHEV